MERSCTALNLKEPVTGRRMRVRAAIDDFGAVHCQRPRIFGIRAFVCHHNPKSADFRVNDRPESVQGQAVFLHPPIEDVMWADGMLDWKQRRAYEMPQDYFARRSEDESGLQGLILP